MLAETAVRSGMSGALLLAALTVGGTAWSQETPKCDEGARLDYLKLADAGASEEELEERFGHCREEPPPSCLDMSKSSLQVTNFSTYYERMNGCGWHPQKSQVACDVEIRQPFGFGPFPSGSYEYALFCLDCNNDGVFEFVTSDRVHATNDISGTTPSWYHSVSASTRDAFKCTLGDGRAFHIRAILSWGARPTHCNYRPIWGNRFDFTARRDP